MTKRIDVIVIGAGHNGLVCATYLARKGLNVTCIESADTAGGMAAWRSLDDAYHFPGMAHVAPSLHPSIVSDLKLDHFGFSQGEPAKTIALDSDGNHLTIGADKAEGKDLPETDAAAYKTFRQQYLDFAASLKPLFENTPPRLKDMPFGDKATLGKLGWNLRFGLGKASMYEFLRVAAINIYDVLNETFEDDRLKGALAADAVMGSAMGPRTPGTVLTWLQKLFGEVNGHPAIQTGRLTDALTQSAEDAGVDIRCGVTVSRILIENDKTFGVALENGDLVKAKTVISNADPRTTFLDLVGAPRLDAMFANRASQIRGSGVVGKLNIALKGLPEFPGVDDDDLKQRLIIAPSMDYVERAFNHSKYGEYSEHPVIELSIPSLHDQALAPGGHHVMSANVAYVPYELEGGWGEETSTLGYKLISLLGQYAPDLTSMIVDHEFLTPADVEREYGARQGHWHHGELSIHQSFMMRPLYGAAQYDTPVEGLYLCGAGCHPGGGLTGLPGRNAARRVIQSGAAK